MENLEREIYRHYFEVGKIRPKAYAAAQNVSLDFLLERYDAFFFDAFGTFYCQHEELYPGALEMYQKVRATGKPMRLVTNAASSAIPQMVESLARMKIPFEASEIFSSGDLFLDLAAKLKIREAFYIGRPGGMSFLEKAGVKASTNPTENTVIVSATAKENSETALALEILKRPNAKLVVLNPDAWAPRMRRPREAVSGALAHELFLQTNAQTFYAGKPFRELYEKALASLGWKDPKKAVMIGDTLATDIGGAQNAGLDAALILGRNQPPAELKTDEAFLKLRPDFYLNF